MEREIDREKIIKRVKRALRSKDHVSRVHFNQKNQAFYRIGPGPLFLQVQRLEKGTFRVMRKPLDGSQLGLWLTKHKKAKK